jgi:hypothetical protein
MPSSEPSPLSRRRSSDAAQPGQCNSLTMFEVPCVSGHLSAGTCQKSASAMPIFITDVEITWSRLIERAAGVPERESCPDPDFCPAAAGRTGLVRFARSRRAHDKRNGFALFFTTTAASAPGDDHGERGERGGSILRIFPPVLRVRRGEIVIGRPRSAERASRLLAGLPRWASKLL